MRYTPGMGKQDETGPLIGDFVGVRDDPFGDAATRERTEMTTETEPTFIPCDAQTLLAQIGRMNIMAISGLRVERRETGVTLPVGSGYSVTVDLDANNTYVVRRVFKRGAKVWIKGEQRNVYCEEVGEVAYQASSFRSYDFPKPV